MIRNESWLDGFNILLLQRSLLTFLNSFFPTKRQRAKGLDSRLRSPKCLEFASFLFLHHHIMAIGVLRKHKEGCLMMENNSCNDWGHVSLGCHAITLRRSHAAIICAFGPLEKKRKYTNETSPTDGSSSETIKNEEATWRELNQNGEREECVAQKRVHVQVALRAQLFIISPSLNFNVTDCSIALPCPACLHNFFSLPCSLLHSAAQK